MLRPLLLAVALLAVAACSSITAPRPDLIPTDTPILTTFTPDSSCSDCAPSLPATRDTLTP